MQQTTGSGEEPVQTGLQSALQHNPAVLDDQSALQPHGEKLKRGPDAPEYNPKVELVDMSTDDLRPHGLAEAVAHDRPILDDTQGTPFHPTDKAGVKHGSGLQGAGHGL